MLTATEEFAKSPPHNGLSTTHSSIFRMISCWMLDGECLQVDVLSVLSGADTKEKAKSRLEELHKSPRSGPQGGTHITVQHQKAW